MILRLIFSHMSKPWHWLLSKVGGSWPTLKVQMAHFTGHPTESVFIKNFILFCYLLSF